MSKSRTTRSKGKTTGVASSSSGNRNKLGALATLLPLAISMIPAAVSVRQPSGQPAEFTVTQPAAQPRAARRAAAPKEFSVPLSNLQEWAQSVLATMDDVTIEGNSKVHKSEADCEMHFGGHSPSYKGDPPGLVLEPMNACSLPFPNKPRQRDADWIEFANKIKNTVVTVSGVPRIWPEHLTGGGGPSNPDHAVEFHPLTEVISNGETFDFSAHVSAGEYRGGVGLPTAESIVKTTTVTVTRSGDNVDISFFSGRIGNFTVLDINVDKSSITADTVGSFRMNGEVLLDDGSSVPVRMVTVKGSPINDEIAKIRSRRRSQIVSLGEMLVLFSLSPEMLLSAANQSNGQPVSIARPIQLILYGPPDV